MINIHQLKYILDYDINFIVNGILDNIYIEAMIEHRQEVADSYTLKDALNGGVDYHILDSDIHDGISNEYNINFDQVRIIIKPYKFKSLYKRLNWLIEQGVSNASDVRQRSSEKSPLKWQYSSYNTYDDIYQDFTNDLRITLKNELAMSFIKDTNITNLQVQCDIEPAGHTNALYISSMDIVLFTNIECIKHN